MTPEIHCCRKDQDLAKAVWHIEELKIRRLPAINKNKQMIGILSLGVSATRRLLIYCGMRQERFGPSLRVT